MFTKLKRLDNFLSKSPEERRRERREALSDGTARLLDNTYPMKNWSARGFCVGSCVLDQHKQIGDRLEIDFSIPLADHRIEFSCRALVLRVDPEKQELAGMFATVDESTQLAIDEHFGIFPGTSAARALVDRVKSAIRGVTSGG